MEILKNCQEKIQKTICVTLKRFLDTKSKNHKGLELLCEQIYRDKEKYIKIKFMEEKTQLDNICVQRYSILSAIKQMQIKMEILFHIYQLWGCVETKTKILKFSLVCVCTATFECKLSAFIQIKNTYKYILHMYM